MLATKTSTGVPPKVNLIRHMQMTVRGSTLALKPRAYLIGSQIQSYQWPQKRINIAQNRFLVKIREKQLEVNPHAIMIEKPTTMASSPLRNL